MEQYNTVSAGKKLGVSAATISRWAKRLSLGQKIGPSLILSEKDVRAISEAHYKTPGNPQFGKKG